MPKYAIMRLASLINIINEHSNSAENFSKIEMSIRPVDDLSQSIWESDKGCKKNTVNRETSNPLPKKGRN